MTHTHTHAHGVHLAAPHHQPKQSKEEIEKFIIDDGLSEVERAHLLLKKGQPIQRLSVLNSFRNLYDPAQPEDSVAAIIQISQVCAPRWVVNDCNGTAHTTTTTTTLMAHIHTLVAVNAAHSSI